METSVQQKKSFLPFIGIAVFLFVVVPVFAVAQGIYKSFPGSGMAQAVGAALNPVVMEVGGVQVRYKEVRAEYNLVKKILETSPNVLPTSGKGTIGQQALERTAERRKRLVAVQQLAAESGISVTEDDIKAVAEEFKTNMQYADDKAFEEAVRKEYDWSMQEFRDYVMVPYALERKAFSGNVAKWKEAAKTEAQRIIKEIADGKTFEEAAAQYGSDGTAQSGGDLGFFARGIMVAEFQAAVEKLKVGETTKEPVETEFGWHIIRLTETKGVGNAKEWRAAHILVSPAKLYDEKILEKMKTLEAKVFVQSK